MAAAETPGIPDAQAGTLYPLLKQTAERSTLELSFLHNRFRDVEAWKREGRAKVRELLRYPEIERIDLVDLDRAVTDLFRDLPLASKLNGGSLSDPRVTIVNDDAFRWLEETPGESWDLAIVDFPDPSNYAVGKL